MANTVQNDLVVRTRKGDVFHLKAVLAKSNYRMVFHGLNHDAWPLLRHVGSDFRKNADNGSMVCTVFKTTCPDLDEEMFKGAFLFTREGQPLGGFVLEIGGKRGRGTWRYGGKTYDSLKDLAEATGTNYVTINKRISRGYTVERAIDTPTRKNLRAK